LGISAFTINHLQDEPRQSVNPSAAFYRVAPGRAGFGCDASRFATRATLPSWRATARLAPAAADPLAGMLDDDDMSRLRR